MEQVLLNKPFAKVTVNKSLRIGKVVWRAGCDLEEYKMAFQKLLTVQKTSPIHFFLSDIREQGIVSPKHRQWFTSFAIPEAKKNGLKMGAVIFTGNVFEKYYINLISEVTKQHDIPMKVVSSVEEALEWFNVAEKQS